MKNLFSCTYMNKISYIASYIAMCNWVRQFNTQLATNNKLYINGLADISQVPSCVHIPVHHAYVCCKLNDFIWFSQHQKMHFLGYINTAVKDIWYQEFIIGEVKESIQLSQYPVHPFFYYELLLVCTGMLGFLSSKTFI